MPDEQGVAQRVMAENLAVQVAFELSQMNVPITLEDALQIAMWYLHTELSTEARAILAEMPVGYDREGAEYMAERLGLDLEGEDT